MKILSFFACILAFVFCNALPPINLFRPSDRPLMPEPIIPCWGGQLSIGYEAAFHTRAFIDNDSVFNQIPCEDSDRLRKRRNVLQIYQERQNILAALKGFDSATKQGQLSQQFNLDDEACHQGTAIPTGSLKIPMNLMFSQRFYFNHGLSFELHLPVYVMELRNACFKILQGEPTSEQVLSEKLLDEIKAVSRLDLRGWKRTGFGDLVAQMCWMRDFETTRPLLTNVRVQTRLGLIFPTGKRRDEDRILAFAFGNDGSWGTQFAAGLDLSLCYGLRAGLDAEFVFLFGNTRERRVKTAANQTDLLFLKKIPTLREHGLGQQFNLYVESQDVWRYLSLKLNYQFLKRNEDRLDIASDRIDGVLVNSAESLQDWTAHSLIFMTTYDFWKECPEKRFLPSLRAWVKWGFNGKRAILANTLGLQFNIAF